MVWRYTNLIQIVLCVTQRLCVSLYLFLHLSHHRLLYLFLCRVLSPSHHCLFILWSSVSTAPAPTLSTSDILLVLLAHPHSSPYYTNPHYTLPFLPHLISVPTTFPPPSPNSPSPPYCRVPPVAKRQHSPSHEISDPEYSSKSS